MPRSKRRPKSTASATSGSHPVVGIDNGANSGVAVTVGGSLVYYAAVEPSALRADALRQVVDHLGVCVNARDVRIYLELPWGGFLRTRLGLMREFGRWVEAAQALGMRAPVGVKPGAWQRVVFKSTPPDRKAAAKQFAMDTLGMADGMPSDVYDAGCIAHYGSIKKPS